MVKADRTSKLSESFEESAGSEARDISGINWGVEADPNMALRPKVINLGRAYLGNKGVQGCSVSKVAVVKVQAIIRDMWIGVDMIESSCVEG